MIDRELLKENIKTIANYKGIKMGDLEEQAGTHTGYFAQIANGGRNVSVEILANVAEILNVSIDTLLHALPEYDSSRCPFCGGEPAMSSSGGIFYVTCIDCSAEGPRDDTPNKAEIAWSKRAFKGGGDMYNWNKIFKEGEDGE